MDPWAAPARTASANVKFEDSSAEPVLSTPDEMYPSLFGANSAAAAPTVNPLETLTPKPLTEEKRADLALLASLTALTQATLAAPPPIPPKPNPEPEKKPVKKRKSWGQVLPEPKTNLPPRKRAKTEDEKEQRRVERVLRNRRAAQSSRERKRLEVEALERRNKELEAALLQAQQINLKLLDEIHKMHQGDGVGKSFSPLSISQHLFGSQDGNGASIPGASSLQHILASSQNGSNTVNPASLSPPTLSPIPEATEEQGQAPTTATTTATATPAAAPAAAPTATATAPPPPPPAATAPAVPAPPAADANATTKESASPDATQHPAAMLCEDLQCPSAEAPPSAWLAASQQPHHPAVPLLLHLQFLLAAASVMVSACRRPLTQIAMSLKAGFSLRPTRSILNTIIWLVTTPHRSSNSTSTSSSPTATSTPRPATSSRRSSPSTAAPSPTRRSSNLRIRILRKILTCSPILARPLMDATMEVLRLVCSEGCSVVRVPGHDESAAPPAAAGEPQRRRPHGWPEGVALPSKEVLLTLLWALRVEERRLQVRDRTCTVSQEPGTQTSVPETRAAPPAPPAPPSAETADVPRVVEALPKRSRDAEDGAAGSGSPCPKRRRPG